VDLRIVVRELEPGDLPELQWTGSSEHLAAIAGDLELAWAGKLVQLVAGLSNGRLVGFGAVDFRRGADSGLIVMLSIHDLLQSLGIGSMLIRELESQIRRHGRDRALIAVEHDNPRAGALYRRLGYRECGSEIVDWSVGAGRRYVTVCTVLERRLPVPAAAGN
jgi:ribosomal protein S18 acetylase RimI-like enzyme